MAAPAREAASSIDIDVAIEHARHVRCRGLGRRSRPRRRPRPPTGGRPILPRLTRGWAMPVAGGRRKIIGDMAPGPADHQTTAPDVRQIGHWVAGRATAGASGRVAPVYDPARGVQIAEVALASAAEVDAAVASALQASHEWGTSSLTRRASLLFRLREILDASRDELAAAVTREHGKVLEDARGEVARGIENVEFACGIPNLLKGSSTRRSRRASTSAPCSSRWAWSPASPRSTFRSWCRCG